MTRPPDYELFAIRYAVRDGRRGDHFIGGDPHDAPMPMDYFVWLARSPERSYVIDTGFTAEVASKRGRQHLMCPTDGLKLLGVAAEDVTDVILTHLHYDHAGTFHKFPKARFHLQEREMTYATSHYMAHARLRHGYEVDDVVGLVKALYGGRLALYPAGLELAPGIELVPCGGHTAGLQCVRVFTKRGWVVVASDVTHFYENIESNRPFVSAFHVGDMLDGFDTLRRIAPSPQHIVPGHDPLVMRRYRAASRELDGVVVRLDEAPTAS